MPEHFIPRSEEAGQWPHSVTPVQIMMNMYLFAMAESAARAKDMELWELINVALWEKLGKPDYERLMNFASSMVVLEKDPAWKRRLQVAVQAEMEMGACKHATERDERDNQPS